MGEVLAAKLIAVPQLCDCRSGRAVCRPGMWRFALERTESTAAIATSPSPGVEAQP